MKKKLFTCILGLLLVLLLALGFVPACKAAKPAPTPTPTPTATPTLTPTPAAKPTPTPTPTLEPLPSEIAIGTHAIGTSYNAMGSGIAKVITENSPLRVTTKPHAGATAYLPIINKGALEIGCPCYTEVWISYAGSPDYPDRLPNLRLLMKGGWIAPMLGLVVRADSGIKSVRDLRGKRVSSDFGPSIMIRYCVDAQLLMGGLTWGDVKPVPVPDVTTALDALQAGQLDACYAGSHESAKVREVDAAIKLRPLPYDVSAESLKILKEKLPLFELDTGKAGAGILREDVQLLKHPLCLVASSQLGERAAYTVVKALWENYEKLWPIAAWLKEWKPETMFHTEPAVPYHPGAVTFYKEKGKWTPQVEEIQQRLLKQK